MAALEGGARGVAFASGMAAEDALVRVTCGPGDHVVIPNDAYGGTYRLFKHGLQAVGPRLRLGVGSRAERDRRRRPSRSDQAGLDRDAEQPAAGDRRHWGDCRHRPRGRGAPGRRQHLRDALSPAADRAAGPTSSCTRRPSTPAATATSSAARSSPPTRSSAPISRPSRTPPAPSPSPFDCFLVLRGLKTLAVRMDRHSANAERVARFLAEHPSVEQVYYPGLVGHPGYDVAKRQMTRLRRHGVVPCRRAASAAARAVCDRARLFTLAESLGGVESLIELPSAMTHASVAESPLAVPLRPGSALRRAGVGRGSDRRPRLRAHRLSPREAAVMAELVSCVDFGSTFTKGALVDVGAGELVATCEPSHDHRHRRARRMGRDLRRVRDRARPSRRAGRRADLRVLVGRRRPSYRRGRQRGTGHGRGGSTRRAVERRPRRAGVVRRCRRRGAACCRVPTSCCSSAEPTAETPRCSWRMPVRWRRARWRAPVVAAGNAEAAGDVGALLARGGTPYVIADNVVPQIGVLRPAGARAAIREMFLSHVIGGKHLSRRADFTRDGSGRRRRTSC